VSPEHHCCPHGSCVFRETDLSISSSVRELSVQPGKGLENFGKQDTAENAWLSPHLKAFYCFSKWPHTRKQIAWVRLFNLR
jgi:hypothetical protein